jgi:hypothetical protein
MIEAPAAIGYSFTLRYVIKVKPLSSNALGGRFRSFQFTQIVSVSSSIL